MRRQTTYTLALITLCLTGFTTIQYALADDGDSPNQVTMDGFSDRPSLVTFDPGGADGVERTVLVNATIVDISGKQFLRGTVTDKHQEINVVFPGKVAYVAFDSIAYIQHLGDGKR